MRFIIILVIILLTRCTGPEPDITVSHFYYENKSGVDVSLILHRPIVENNETIYIANDNQYYEDVLVKGGVYIPLVCDSLEISFSSNKSKIYRISDNSPRNPLLLKSYVITKNNVGHDEYRYTITEEDLLSLID